MDFAGAFWAFYGTVLAIVIALIIVAFGGGLLLGWWLL